MLNDERRNIAVMFSVAGGGQGAAGQNTGQGFVNFVDWSERTAAEDSADAISERATKAFSAFRDAQVNVLVPAAIRGLGQTNGFSLQLQNTSGMSREEFVEARDKLLELAENDPLLAGVRLGELPDVQTLQVDIDQPKLASLGLNQNDVNTTLSAAWGGQYVNDFIDRGRVKRVFVQADAPYRATPDDIGRWFVRGNDGQMAPFSAFARTRWSTTPTTLSRFQGYPSFQYEGQAAPGQSSGEAIDRI